MTTLKPPFRAGDMNGLYKRVIKGAYPEIPKKYTQDLSDVIQQMLSVEPKLRPSCAQILQAPQITKRLAKLFPNEYTQGQDGSDIFLITEEEDQDLLNGNGLLHTIKVPTNLSNLTKNLPKANYNIK